MKTTAEVLPLLEGATLRDVDNWIARLELATSYEPTARGRFRLFSRANALELSFIAALTRVGAKPSSAAAYARSLVRHATRGVGPQNRWLVFSAGELQRAFPTDDISEATLRAQYPDRTTFSLINVADIITRVDALYLDGAA